MSASGAAYLTAGEADGPAPADLVCVLGEIGEGAADALARTARAKGRVLEREGLSVYGLGTAARLVLPGGLSGAKPDALDSLLASISLLGDPAAGDGSPLVPPLCFGALGFDSTRPAELVVPEVTVVVSPGRAPLGALVAERAAARRAAGRLPFADVAPEDTPPPPAPDGFELASVRSHEDFLARVAEALTAVRSGALDKVVLAREVAVTANRPFAQGALLERLRALYPSCATFCIDGFVGASPELLLRRVGPLVRSQPLAGTVARSGDPAEDARLQAALYASLKERSEHAFVVTAIEEGLRRAGGVVTSPVGPSLLELRNVVHLSSALVARFSDPAPSALALVGELHPTPAVAGVPREAALSYLATHEDLDRDRYAGPVGVSDAGGNGEWWLGIRSAIVRGQHARLIAGVGIVADSEPTAELAETQLKLQALLAAAVRP